jgi:hypothetical protein
MKKLIFIAVLVFAAVAAPIQAKGPKGPHPSPPTPPANKCQAHTISYEVWGTLISGSLTLNANGTYSGTLTVHVKQSDNHAKSDRNTNKTYTLASSHLNIHGANPAALAANSRVHLQGTVTTLAKKCNHTGFTATIAILRGDLKAPQQH